MDQKRTTGMMIGRLALEAGWISGAELSAAKRQARASGSSVGDVLVVQGALEAGQLRRLQRRKARRLREQHALGRLAVEKGYLETEVLGEALSKQKALAERGIPVRVGQLCVAKGKLSVEQLHDVLWAQTRSVARCRPCDKAFRRVDTTSRTMTSCPSCDTPLETGAVPSKAELTQEARQLTRRLKRWGARPAQVTQSRTPPRPASGRARRAPMSSRIPLSSRLPAAAPAPALAAPPRQAEPRPVRAACPSARVGAGRRGWGMVLTLLVAGLLGGTGWAATGLFAPAPAPVEAPVPAIAAAPEAGSAPMRAEAIGRVTVSEDSLALEIGAPHGLVWLVADADGVHAEALARIQRYVAGGGQVSLRVTGRWTTDAGASRIELSSWARVSGATRHSLVLGR